MSFSPFHTPGSESGYGWPTSPRSNYSGSCAALADEVTDGDHVVFDDFEEG